VPKKDHKVAKAKARKEAIRKQKAQGSAQPRVYRENPGLGAALSTRHPLVGYYVNPDWEEMGMAVVHCIRQAPAGQVLAGFLVDLAWKGTKDCFGTFGDGDALTELEARRKESAIHHGEPYHKLVPLDAADAVNMIRGGVVWARQQRQRLPSDLDRWLRVVDPLPPEGPDLTLFGDGEGHPVILGTPEELGLDADEWDLLGDDAEWDDEDEDWDDAEEDEEAADPNLIEGEVIAQQPALESGSATDEPSRRGLFGLFGSKKEA
jgi:hypothetical protein